MQMCHIVPGLNTSLIDGQAYAMCLAQFVMTDAAYADAYRDLSVGTRTHLIMDNGLAEEGTPLKVADLGKSIPLCEPSEVVLPDYLTPADNIKAAHYALHEAADFLGIVDGYGIELMYVPHGNSIHEYAANVTDLHNFGRLPDSFGISKFHDQAHLLSHIFGRGPLAMLVKAYFPDKPIHYLGLGGPIQELRMLPNGRSCDTCYAYMAAAHNLKLEPSMLFRPPVVDYEHSATLNHKQRLLFNANVATLDEIVAEVEWHVW